jgi:hypothetical protein
VAGFITLVFLIVLAILLLKGFDKIAGRGPKQVSDGIKRADVSRPSNPEGRIPCPQCAEMILPAAKICPFCRSSVNHSV